jgi:phosphate transport system substrate-binding protein
MRFAPGKEVRAMKKRFKGFVVLFSVLLLSFVVYYFFFYLENTEKTLLIGGSSTVYHYTKALAEAYMEEKGNTKIICESGGSKPGLIAVKNGSIDIASMSRDLEDEEDDAFTKNYLIGKDAVGMVVHPSNPVENLTMDQILGIISGEINDWNQVGGEDRPIQVITREPESTTWKGLNEIVLKGADVADSAIVAKSARQMAAAVAGDPEAFGFLALSDLQNSVKLLKVGNVPMSRTTILTDRYPLSRSFYYVVYDLPDPEAEGKKGHLFFREIVSLFRTDDESIQQKRIKTIRDFLDYVKSPQGQEIIEREGAIGIN